MIAFKDYIFPHFFGVWQYADYPNYGLNYIFYG